jgi:hypothetical protein
MLPKKIISFSLLFLLVFSFYAPPWMPHESEAVEVWIEIGDRTELQNIQSNLTANYRLTANIDLNNETWTPLGEFTGKLDGNSKTISNLVITDTATENRGLFSIVGTGATINNLSIEGASLTVGNSAGILAGINRGTVSACSTKGSISGNENVGGLVGKNEGTIEDSYNLASVSAKDKVGGLAGNNSGTITRSYSASEMAPPVFNNYLSFNGTTGYISIPHLEAYNSSSFTLEAWFQWDKVNAPTDDVQFIMGKGNLVGENEYFEIHTEGGSLGNGLRFIPIPHDSSDSWLDARNVLQTGWFHVAAVYSYDAGAEEASASFYVNGIAQDIWQKIPGSTPPIPENFQNIGKTATMSGRTSQPTNSGPISIGRRADGGSYFQGKIADVRIWNTARTEEQVRTNKDRVLQGNEAGLVGYW